MAQHLTKPVEQSGMPSGIPFIIGNEAAERFSYYGMKGILVVYMTTHMLNAAGMPDRLSEEKANGVYHLFAAASYFFPIIGALLADVFFGKYKTILVLSLGYCIGHGLIALGDTGLVRTTGIDPKYWLYGGLVFIAIGAGGIKPCVSAHVGDQFGARNKKLIQRVFAWFYFSINVGAAAANFLIPWLLEHKGAAWAFGLPGALMAIATFLFWLGRNRFVHIPPGGKAFLRETLSPAGRRAMLNLAPIFLIFIAMFWALFDQTGSSWTLQARDLDLHFMGIEWLPAQIQLANPLLILALVPIFSLVIYPLIDKVFPLTPLRKIGLGLFLTVIAFCVPSLIEMKLTADPDAQISVGWQLVGYLLLTSAEVMVSITALEFAYTQAPKKMKSFIMGIYFLGVSLGNLFASGVNFAIELMKDEDGKTWLDGAAYFWFFTGMMLLVSIAYIFMAKMYRGSTYVQGEDDLIESKSEAEGIGNV